MRALVTGAAGFVGGWLVAALRERGADVHGVALAARDDSSVTWHVGDVRDAVVLRAALDASAPDVVYHLAGISSVGGADDDPGAAADVNVTATVRLLAEAARARDGGADPTLVIVGSGEQYGAHPDAAQPLDEGAEQRPATLYAATKTAQEAFALQAWRRHGVRVVCARSFNHTGPGQSASFLIPALVQRALALRASGGGSLRLGNLSPVRDVSHVADVVDAYILLAERGRPGEAYNVCSGIGRSVADIATAVLRRVGIDVAVESDPSLTRPADVPILVGDHAKLRAHTGWEPARTLDDCIDDLIRHAEAH